MACKTSSDCPRGHVCNDGVCEPASGFTEEKETVTIAKTKHDRYLDAQADMRKLDIYSQFVNDEIQEAIKARDEEAEDIDFWGTMGAIGGGIVGGILGIPGGPAGIATGATIGAGVGSGATRTITDFLGDAEDYGLSDTEMDMFEEADFKYVKEEFFDLYKEGEEMQADLDEYDEDQWKTHVMLTLQDTWTAFKVANAAASVASVMESFGEEAVGELSSELLAEEAISIEQGGWSEQISNITESLKNPLQQQLVPPE